MVNLLICSDFGLPTGFGRISTEVANRLHKRGLNLKAASYTYDGMLPAQYDNQTLPYWVSPLVGKPNYAVNEIAQLISVHQPEIIIVTQDFPYSQTLRTLPLDWSRYGFIIVTPVDGKPVHPAWIDAAKHADAILTISQFGVDALAEQGIEAKLLRPAVNLDKFYRLPDAERLVLREKVGIAAGAFVLGVVAMNQGRKSIPETIRAFVRFAQDKPTARMVLDTDTISPAGWDFLSMCEQFNWPREKLIFRDALLKVGLFEMRERYALMDVHAVISHREGYGLPLAEAMACGVISAAIDWSSGTEVVGGGKGLLIKPLMVGDKPYSTISSWGNALDYYADEDDFVQQLQHVYEHPAERAAIAEKGQIWARSHTWDMAADVMAETIERVVSKRQKVAPSIPAMLPSPTAAPQVQPDGQKAEVVQLVEM